MRFITADGGKMAVYLPWQMIFYLVIGSVTGIVTSLFTAPVSKERLARFFALTRTPIRPGEEIKEPCVLPEGTREAPPDYLFTRWGLMIPRPSAIGIAGFFGSWALVAAIVYIFFLIAGK